MMKAATKKQSTVSNVPASAELPFLTIAELAALIKKRDLSPVELARCLLDRIEKCDMQVNAFITLTAEHAMKQARAAEKDIVAGRYRGALHGIPFGLKDVIETAGILTTAHSKILERNHPAADA